MTTARTTQAKAEILRDLTDLQQGLQSQWLDRSLPSDWSGLDSLAPIERPKTRVTLNLDEDMVKWFRKLGYGYQKRINQVLRIYWNALIVGMVQAHWDEDDLSPGFEQMIETLANRD